MSKFNTGAHRPLAPVMSSGSPLRTGSLAAPDTRTFEGAPGWQRDIRTDIFFRATSSFSGGEKSFYESGETRDETLRQLARQLAIEDFAWLCKFAQWLRGPGNIRTAALMIAADAVKARLEAGITSLAYPNRWLIDAVCQRADEPGELLAYWLATYGRKIPKPVKRGLADAARRLYKERSLLKYDTSSHAVRFADVLELCHPSPVGAWQGDLFKYAIDRRHGHGDPEPELSLPMVRANIGLRQSDNVGRWLNPETLRASGMTWEDALSAVGSKVDKAELWEAMIPSMGYMALLRNLRGFDEAGVSNKVADQVIAKLKDPDEVAKSRQLPFRFYSAYKATSSLRWAHALETALDLCLPNIPQLSGRTLVLIDTSGSMGDSVSNNSTMKIVEAAALFGSALAIKNPEAVDLYQFAMGEARFTVPKGGSVLRLTNDVMANIGRVGHGTDISGAVLRQYSGHDRVIILTDGQGASWGGPASAVASNVPKTTPVYLFNVQSYSASPMPTGEAARFDLGGLTDATFALIPRLEAGLHGAWPWDLAAAA